MKIDLEMYEEMMDEVLEEGSHREHLVHRKHDKSCEKKNTKRVREAKRNRHIDIWESECYETLR